jgi:hypothetical protein
VEYLPGTRTCFKWSLRTNITIDLLESAYLYSHCRITHVQNDDAVGYAIGGLHKHQILNVSLDKVGFDDLEIW